MLDKAIGRWTGITMIALLTHYSGGNWLILLLGGILASMSKAWMKKMDPGHTENKGLIAAQLVGIYLMVTKILPTSAAYWPGEKASIVVPGVILVMAILGDRKRPERVAGVLMWVMVLIAVPLFLAGIRNAKIEWINVQGLAGTIWIVPIILYPYIIKEATGVQMKEKGYLGVITIGVVIWMIVRAVLSRKVALNEANPFRVMTMSLSVGEQNRFEWLGSTLITLGYFAFASLSLYCTHCLWGRIGIRKKEIEWVEGILLLIGVCSQNLIPEDIVVFYVIIVYIL